MNVLDWILLIYSILHILIIQKLENELHSKLSLSIVLILIFFRCFLGFQILKLFTAIIGIINGILFKLGPFLLIVGFFYCTTAIVFFSLDTSADKITVLRDMYYWTIFGGIDDAAFQIQLSAIPIFFGTFIISILLMNILIAYLSNEYSRLEERQVFEDLQTKAELNLDVEMVISFLKRLFSKSFRKSFQFRNQQYKKMMNVLANSNKKFLKVIFFLNNK